MKAMTTMAITPPRIGCGSRVRATILTSGLSLLLMACAHQGNLAHAPAAYDGQMARDAARAMREVWPPQNTLLRTESVSTQNPFLSVLLEQLRAEGYALAPAASKTGSELHYVLDRLDDSHYRVSVRIEGHSIHRLYQVAQGQLAPASAWTRQE